MSSTSAECLIQLRREGTPCVYPPGARMFLAGDAPRSVFLIEDGLVKLVCERKDGRQFVAAFRSTGWILGAAAAIAQKSYPASAEVVIRLRAIQIASTQFTELLSKQPKISNFVQVMHSSDICEYVEQLCSIALFPARIRLLMLLRRTVRDVSSQGRLLPIPPILHQDLASAIAVTPTHLSRVVRQLEIEGLVERKGSRLFLNSSVLSAR